MHAFAAATPAAGPGSSEVSDASGSVTICKGQGLFLRADDAGLVVRNFYGRTRRIAWTEISHFADGSYTKEGVTGWQLFIVLRTGKRIRVTSSVLAPAGEVVAAVREAARPHGIPADLAGFATKKGRPAQRGLYHDPGGQAALRYWDGRQWSPLLPPGASKWSSRRSSRKVRESPGLWAALPTAEGHWTGAATLAMRLAVVSAVAAVVSAGLLGWGLLAELGLYTYHGRIGVAGWLSLYLFALMFALAARGSSMDRKFLLKLDEAARGSAGVVTGWPPADVEQDLPRLAPGPEAGGAAD